MNKIITIILTFISLNCSGQSDSTNLYAFVGELISISLIERDPGKIYFNSAFMAKCQVIKNVYNTLKTDTVVFRVYDHYGKPRFASFRNFLIYISFDKEEGDFYHQKYMFDPVYLTTDSEWVGISNDYKHPYFSNKNDKEYMVVPFNPRNYLLQNFITLEGSRTKLIEGNTLMELFFLKRNGTLRARKIFE